MPELGLLSPLILVGATTSGKSAIAREIADRTEGHLVNSDKFFLYAGKVFMLGLGLDRGELDDGRQRHLYGHLQPMNEPLAPDKYLAEAIKTIDGIHQAGRVAIVEGCMRSYNEALISYYGIRHAIGITCEDKQTVLPLIQRRGDKLIAMGLYDEAEQVYKEGYAEAFPAREGFIYKPAIAALLGEISRREAQESMEQGGLELALAQDHTYTSMSGLHVIAHDQRHPDLIADQIIVRQSAATA
jgi:tRNA A37 N6-isopentenylltransferase MiaA